MSDYTNGSHGGSESRHLHRPPREELWARAVREEIISHLDDPYSNANCGIVDAYIEDGRAVVFVGAATDMGRELAVAMYGPDEGAMEGGASVRWHGARHFGDRATGWSEYAVIPHDGLSLDEITEGAELRLAELLGEPVDLVEEIRRAVEHNARVVGAGYLEEDTGKRKAGTPYVDVRPNSMDDHDTMRKRLKKVPGVEEEGKRERREAERYWEVRVYGPEDDAFGL